LERSFTTYATDADFLAARRVGQLSEHRPMEKSQVLKGMKALEDGCQRTEQRVYGILKN